MPGIVENEEGWGPTTVPEHLEGVPYAPYGKGDKVGRVSDFTQSGFNKYGGMLSWVIPCYPTRMKPRPDMKTESLMLPCRSLWEPEPAELPSSLQFLVQ